MATLRTIHARFIVSIFVLLMIPLGLMLTPETSNAEEGRPWGRLNKPLLSAPESKRKSGYLGRYNPWSNSGEPASDEPPRYRQRGDDDPSSQEAELNPYTGIQGYPPRSPRALMPRNYPYDSTGGAYYSTPTLPSSTPPFFSPWSGGMNPNYGNYGNDPYDSMQPGRGILWSDMWR